MAKDTSHVDWDSASFETLVEESGAPLEFANVGDQFVGIFEGTRVVTFEDRDEGEQTFNVHQFRDRDGNLRTINGGYKLDNGLAEVAKGKLVRVTRTADVPMKNQPSPMKDYRIEVAS